MTGKKNKSGKTKGAPAEPAAQTNKSTTKKGGKPKNPPQTSARKPNSSSSNNNGNDARSKRSKAKPKIRTPKTAAVVITPTAEGTSRAEIMAEARRRIKLEDLNITHVRPKIAATGAIILEILGENGSGKADKLAERLRQELRDKPVRITRPLK